MEQIDACVSECDKVSQDLVSDLHEQLDCLNEKTKQLQGELDDFNKQSKAAHVIAHVIQNSMKGQQAAIYELTSRIDWHHKINSSLVKEIVRVTAQHQQMHISTNPVPMEAIINQQEMDYNKTVSHNPMAQDMVSPSQVKMDVNQPHF